MFNLYFVQGSETILSLWKKSGTMTGTPIHLLCLKYLFGMPPAALKMYERDDSGISHQALPSSHVQPHNRVDYRTHESLIRFTNGSGLQGFYERWVTGYRDRLQSLDIGDEWIAMPDLMGFFNDTFGAALIESICGRDFLDLNPHCSRDFSNYDLAVQKLLKGLPRWIIPQAYRARDKLLSAIKKWHDSATSRSGESSIVQTGDTDPYWGSSFMRERHGPDGIFSTVDNFDKDASASSDLGFIWA